MPIVPEVFQTSRSKTIQPKKRKTKKRKTKTKTKSAQYKK